MTVISCPVVQYTSTNSLRDMEPRKVQPGYGQATDRHDRPTTSIRCLCVHSRSRRPNSRAGLALNPVTCAARR